MPQVVRLQLEQSADFDRWQGYVRGRDDTHCTDLGEWRLLFRDLYGLESHSFAAVDGERTVGLLSLCHVPSPFTGKVLVTCPFFGYGGFYWDEPSARDALLHRARELADELRVDTIEIRSRERLPEPFRANEDFSEYSLPLAGDAEQTWSDALSSNVRQNIRRARKQELQFAMSSDPAPCFDLLRRTLRAHGTPFHGRRFFDLLLSRLGDRVRFSEVRHRGALVAAGIVVRGRGAIITPYIGSLHSHRALRPNYLQYWKLVELGHDEGVGRFEMGRSPRGSTHARFKSKWGCEELALYYNYLVVNPRAGYRSVSRPSPAQKLATTVWKRLPLPLTTLLGPRLFRYIP